MTHPITQCPDCTGTLTTLVTAQARDPVGYKCEACDTSIDLCLVEKSDGTRCRRLATACSYHGQEA